MAPAGFGTAALPPQISGRSFAGAGAAPAGSAVLIAVTASAQLFAGWLLAAAARGSPPALQMSGVEARDVEVWQLVDERLNEVRRMPYNDLCRQVTPSPRRSRPTPPAASVLTARRPAK